MATGVEKPDENGAGPFFSEAELDEQSARLLRAYDPETFAIQSAAAARMVREHLARALAGERAVWPVTSPEDMLAAWPDPASAPAVDLEQVLQQFLAGSTAQHHPGFVGQQLSTPPPLAGPVALVSTVVNNSATTGRGS